MAETRKTKKELLEEIAALKREVERVDKQKQFEDAASDIKMQYDAFVAAGFSEERAYEMLMTFIKSAGRVI